MVRESEMAWLNSSNTSRALPTTKFDSSFCQVTNCRGSHRSETTQHKGHQVIENHVQSLMNVLWRNEYLSKPAAPHRKAMSVYVNPATHTHTRSHDLPTKVSSLVRLVAPQHNLGRTKMHTYRWLWMHCDLWYSNYNLPPLTEKQVTRPNSDNQKTVHQQTKEVVPLWIWSPSQPLPCKSSHHPPELGFDQILEAETSTY